MRFASLHQVYLWGGGNTTESKDNGKIWSKARSKTLADSLSDLSSDRPTSSGGVRAPVRSPRPYPDQQLVEVYHCYEDLEYYWMYLAVGSGIYFNLGRTIAARNAMALAHSLNVTAHVVFSLRRFPRCWATHRAPGFHCASARESMHQAWLIRQACWCRIGVGFEMLHRRFQARCSALEHGRL